MWSSSTIIDVCNLEDSAFPRKTNYKKAEEKKVSKEMEVTFNLRLQRLIANFADDFAEIPIGMRSQIHQRYILLKILIPRHIY